MRQKIFHFQGAHLLEPQKIALSPAAQVHYGLGPSIIAEFANSKLRPRVHHGFRPRVHYFNEFAVNSVSLEK